MDLTKCLWEEIVGSNQLDAVVGNVDNPDLVAQLADTDTDAVALNSSSSALNHALCHCQQICQGYHSQCQKVRT